ncbi:MAG: phosphatase PAP2 family protein [Clostridia bacterium]|nr:phosphatase PAP2 family protein [Clostridia bacterium]
MNRRAKIILAEVLLLLTLVLILMLLKVDVDDIGPCGTSVGFSHLNGAISSRFGWNKFFSLVTNATAILAILIGAGFAFLGVMELIQRKSLKKVDSLFYALAGLYVVMGIVYVLFDKLIIVNYRPILEAGKTFPEPSFPSSHTLLVCVVMGSAILALGKFIRNKKIRLIVDCVLGFLIVLTAAGRILAGVHWFTDVLGGLLIGAFLVVLFWAVLDYLKEIRGR